MGNDAGPGSLSASVPGRGRRKHQYSCRARVFSTIVSIIISPLPWSPINSLSRICSIRNERFGVPPRGSAEALGDKASLLVLPLLLPSDFHRTYTKLKSPCLVEETHASVRTARRRARTRTRTSDDR